ncbi:hypothetical protein THAOC_04682 [Thalassiosira oceanica]|uniref:Uncharacterized protein n=1 Tax=Thalassiosira oceanica TaxID=159749 RepID=K0TIT4_THAOC|nr:hypothetical protein THAOC_04682 [Thalassiosira oceanica]|eukprot:EJK73681.1 hypothetical protein THAOC_04682 [Thalassiosira oceanica]
MEIDIIQINSKPTALVASFAPYTLDWKSVHQESQSRQGLMLSALTTPHECSTTKASRDSVLFFNLDADELQIIRRNESAVTPSELSALAKWKKAKKNQRPRNTRRQHSNPNVMNASAGRQATPWPPSTATGPTTVVAMLLGQNRRFNDSGSVFHAEPPPPCTKAYQNQNSPRRLGDRP